MVETQGAGFFHAYLEVGGYGEAVFHMSNMAKPSRATSSSTDIQSTVIYSYEPLFPARESSKSQTSSPVPERRRGFRRASPDLSRKPK